MKNFYQEYYCFLQNHHFDNFVFKLLILMLQFKSKEEYFLL